MIEIRTNSQTKLWKLALNPMRENTESTQFIAWSDDKQKLIEWYNSQVEPSTEYGSPSFECHGDTHLWHKSFKVGGPLEWYNPLDNPIDNPASINHYGQGISSEWVNDDIILTIHSPYRVC